MIQNSLMLPPLSPLWLIRGKGMVMPIGFPSIETEIDSTARIKVTRIQINCLQLGTGTDLLLVTEIEEGDRPVPVCQREGPGGQGPGQGPEGRNGKYLLLMAVLYKRSC